MNDIWIVIVCDEDFDMNCEVFATEREAREHAAIYANEIEEGIYERVDVFNRILPE